MKASRILVIASIGAAGCAASQPEPAAAPQAEQPPALQMQVQAAQPPAPQTQAVEPAPQTIEVSASSGEEQVVCRRVRETGSHFTVRRCATRAELAKTREESQEFLRRQGREGPFIEANAQ